MGDFENPSAEDYGETPAGMRKRLEAMTQAPWVSERVRAAVRWALNSLEIQEAKRLDREARENLLIDALKNIRTWVKDEVKEAFVKASIVGEDHLDPSTPIEVVDAELRAAARARGALRSIADGEVPDDGPVRRVERMRLDFRPSADACEECHGSANFNGARRYYLPVHNGVDAYPVETWLCTACAYLLAEDLSELAEARRA
jgi:hypothetical protein